MNNTRSDSGALTHTKEECTVRKKVLTRRRLRNLRTYEKEIHTGSDSRGVPLKKTSGIDSIGTRRRVDFSINK